MHDFRIIDNENFAEGRYILYVDGEAIISCDSLIHLVKLVEKIICR